MGSTIDSCYYAKFKDYLQKKTADPGGVFSNKATLIGGVDEAGRGAVIGPMVVAGVTVKAQDLNVLEQIQVRDSKELSRKERSSLYGQIVDIAKSICVCVVQATEIDHHVSSNRLNYLEAMAMAHIIDNLRADSIVVDCCDVNQEKFRTNIINNVRTRLRLERGKLDIFSFHHADRLNLAVSAASVVAKVIREEEIGNIKKLYHGIGSGYPSDKNTTRFIRSWIEEVGSPPPFVRSSWRPVKKLLSERRQRHISVFGEEYVIK